MTHPKSMSRQQLELGLCLFLQCIGCQKREQILVLRFSSASFWVSTIPGHCSSTNSFHAWVLWSVRALNMCRSVLAPIQAVLPFRQMWALGVYVMEAAMVWFSKALQHTFSCTCVRFTLIQKHVIQKVNSELTWVLYCTRADIPKTLSNLTTWKRCRVLKCNGRSTIYRGVTQTPVPQHFRFENAVLQSSL